MKNSTNKFRKSVLVACTTLLINSVSYAQTNNYFAGQGAGYLNTGSSNVGVGDNSLGASSSSIGNSGNANTAVGVYTLNYNDGGSGNTAIGYTALKNNSSGDHNVAVGMNALLNNETGSNNVANGWLALYYNSSGGNNTATGTGGLYFNTTGNSNSSYGYNSMYYNSTGYFNTANGAYTLYTNTTGFFNLASGGFSLYSNLTGSRNAAYGHCALYYNSTGYSNNATGAFSMYLNTTGYNNTSMGDSSLYRSTTGSSNTGIGKNAGSLQTVYNKCTFVGTNADASSSGRTNATAIGYGASVNASNKVRVGNTAVTSIGGQVGWTTSSDRRLKTNITESKLGLDFIMNLNPVTYNYIEEGQKDILYTGLIAQEVDEAAKREGIEFSGVDRNGEYWGIRYGDLTVPLIKAVQDQQEIIKNLQSEIADLKNQSANNSSEKSSKTVLTYENKLEQNSPNPFSDKTTIRYSVSADAISAHVIIRSLNGVELKTILLDRKENGSVTIESSKLAQGTYTYTLEVDGKSIDTKLMVITK